MKKILCVILFAGLMVATSCKEHAKSFSEIINEDLKKDDSAKYKKELLHIADSIRKNDASFDKRHKPVNNDTTNGFRIRKNEQITIEDGFTRIKTLNGDLIHILYELNSDNYYLDTLVFTLGIIHNQTQADVYNIDAGTSYPLNGPDGLKGRPVLLVHVKQTRGNAGTPLAQTQTAVAKSLTYIAGRICPPPSPCN